MNVNEVKQAQETVRNARNELALIVKDYFESTRIIIATNMLGINIEDFEKVSSFYTVIKNNNLKIEVNILCRNFYDCIYTISCAELGIYSYYPGIYNCLTAQGEAEVIILENQSEKKSILKKIRFRNYNVN